MDTKETEKKPFLSSGVKWVVGSLVGVGTGVTKFVTDVRAEFHDNTVKGLEFKPTLKWHGKEIGRIKAERRAGELTTEEFISQTHAQKNKFATKIAEFTEELGIVSKGTNQWLGGSIQRYRTLSENARTPLVFASVSTAVIGFAGTSMFMNSLANRKKIDTLTKVPTDQPQSQR